MKQIREACLIFIGQTTQYSVVCFSWRAVGQANVAVAVLTDLFYGAIMFSLIRRIAHTANALTGQIAYATGCALGTWIGIKISLAVLGK